jgi:hypothetical protein
LLPALLLVCCSSFKEMQGSLLLLLLLPAARSPTVPLLLYVTSGSDTAWGCCFAELPLLPLLSPSA